MSEPRFTDPELQAIYTSLLPPAAGGPQSSSPEAVAAAEGLDLADDLAAVRRPTARGSATQRRAGRAGRRRQDRRTLESHAFTLLSRQAVHLRPAELRTRARAWAQAGLWPQEMEAWIAAVGVDGAAIARDCRQAGIALSVMDVVLDGVRVKQRLRGGEPALSVQARAASCERPLSS
ncbi:hypothetical protein [Streptomyces sp. JNUCC 63]